MRFRFLVDEPRDGPLNMAIDEALFLSSSENSEWATVRLYGFDPPTVSFGYRQSLEQAVDVPTCRRLGIGWVRRPTGGRALLHQHEITYSVCAPTEGVFRGLGVRAVYDSVSGAIRGALNRVGVILDPAAETGARTRESDLHLPCLALPGPHEITSGGSKLVASAQRRGRRAFLQHGSILRRVDVELWTRLAPRGQPGSRLRAVGIDELTGAPLPRERLVSSLQGAFEELFESKAVAAGLSRPELERVSELLGKYRLA